MDRFTIRILNCITVIIQMQSRYWCDW
jgi:hypothetical protein